MSPKAEPPAVQDGPAACSGCRSGELTRLPMALTDGTPVLFLSCNHCDRREWFTPTDAGWVTLPIETVLERSTRRKP